MLSEEGTEILLSMLEVCGFLEDGSDSARRRLVTIIRKLGIRLAQNRPIGGSLDQETQASLMELESCLSSVRGEVDSFLQELSLEYAEMVDLCRDFQGLHEADAWTVACRSLQSAYLKHNLKEHEMVSNFVVDLDSLYDTGDELINATRLDSLVACLLRDDLLQRTDLLDYVEILNTDSSSPAPQVHRLSHPPLGPKTDSAVQCCIQKS